MTAHNLNFGTSRRERVSFVPTTFFAEFLAGAHSFKSESHHDAHGYTKHRLIHADIVPALPSKGR